MKRLKCRNLILQGLVSITGILLCSCSNFYKISAKRHLESVWAGTPSDVNDTLPELIDDRLYPLEKNDHITTDENGEGWLYLDGCPTIYVFQESELVRSVNSKSVRESGNITSLYGGTAVWNNHCASKIEMLSTDTAKISLDGTWVGVTYLPSSQLSLVGVFEGNAKVRPLVGSETRQFTEEIDVPAGNFLFNTPGEEEEIIGGLNARQIYPFEELPRLLVGLNSWEYVWKWLPRIQERAETDEIPFPSYIINECKVVTGSKNDSWELFKSIDEENNEGRASVEEVVDGTRFLAITRLESENFIFGASPQSVGWIESEALDCTFPTSQLIDIAPQDSARQVSVDETKPEISHLRFAPSQPTSDDIVLFQIEAQDIDSGITSITIFVDEELKKTCQSESCAISLPSFSTESFREVPYRVEVIDKARNVEQKTGTLRVVAAPPPPPPPPDLSKPIITSPNSIQLINGMGRLTVRAKDTGGSISQIEISKNGNHVKTCRNTKACTINFHQSDYRKEFTFVAVDASGNKAVRKVMYR